MKKILHVVGARPNFMKIAPIMREMAQYPDQFKQMLVHTGQHYDANMSQVFFEELDMPRPDVNLEVGSGSHARQTAQVMQRFEPIILEHKPDWIIVPGDVNSTIACALVASKLGVKIAHVEAGLRSFDRSMPEEINRILTDQISDLLLTPSLDANDNLLREGIAPDKIHFVGNVMIDTLVRLLPKAESLWPSLKAQHNLDRYILVTLHRPSNVDEPDTLSEIISAMMEVSQQIPVLFPVHPRTLSRIEALGLNINSNGNNHLIMTNPLGYLDFLALQIHATLLLTDSGGIQEETTYLGVPCLTARPNTERPVTLTHGTNQLVKSQRDAIIDATEKALNSQARCKQIPKLWDGLSSQRIVDVFLGDIK
ncbi:non-hydrolyzing UDP-N-acetylglucosamine 2-epimerase [Syntrophorhabdus aromaticivorans]|uniref:non-hydrolyzing UDP-N-acetylglucosamine 2-epimerase n=1 Tax=Syntrophorhabdus aromaticivorans TaxID=328301 RepID=UPI0004238CE0|nr:UDP-N-acetylglucosamine 2-epimerase (non-hydrolyzing) [Syntrophorhabdus aromaticivorans]